MFLALLCVPPAAVLRSCANVRAVTAVTVLLDVTIGGSELLIGELRIERRVSPHITMLIILHLHMPVIQYSYLCSITTR